jgi:predicted ATPase/transcriptional regulator with XRE-family HTH domain
LAEVPFGEWLKRRRKAAGWTQEQLAQQISCSTSALKKIEAEERRPSAQIIARLAEVFHIPPKEGPLFFRFARGDWRSTPVEVTEDAPWRASTEATRSHLPSTVTSLIGREQEITRVCEYLLNPDIRLVTLIGPPGIGKTRLSLEVGREMSSHFPDGVFFIPLAALDNPAHVAPAIVQTLGFTEAERKPSVERLKEGIAEKHLLLVLDNLEHVIEHAASIVSDLLAACPHLKILATSREALRVPGEWLYPVPVLNVPTVSQLQSIGINEISKYPALKLFTERARAVRPDFELNAGNIRAVAMICAHLDGLPLAIELIAARIRLMPPESVLARLTDQFTLHADGMRARPARQKTLHNAIRWSYDLLSREEQDLFARVSVFSDGFSLEAAEWMFSRNTTHPSISDLIVSLLDKSLLQNTSGEGGIPRFTMLMTMQQFALDRLRQMNEEAIVRDWHLSYFMHLVENAEPHLRTFDMLIWLNRLEADQGNIRTALAWALEKEIETGLRVAGALWWFWHIRDHKTEGVEWLEQALRIESSERRNQALTPDRAMIRGKALYVAGFLRLMFLETDQGASLSEESLALFRELGPSGRQGMAYALWNLGVAAGQRADPPKRKALMEESLALFREVGDTFGIAQCLPSLADIVLVMEGNYERAKALAEEGLALRQKIGDKDGIADTLWALGHLAFQQGHYREATARFESSLDLFREIGNEYGLIGVLFGLGEAAKAQDLYEKAASALEEARMLAKDTGSKRVIAYIFYWLGEVAALQGGYQRAMKLYKEGLAIGEQTENPGNVAYGLSGLGRLSQVQGDSMAARVFYRKALELYRQRTNGPDYPIRPWRWLKTYRSVAAYPVNALAILETTQGQMEQAATLFGAAEVLYTGIRAEMSPMERVEYDRAVGAARAFLGEETFTAAWEAGKAMTMEQAIAYALEN